MTESPGRLDLLQGTLEMMVLRTLLLGPSNGYQIAKTIEQMSDDILQIDHGSLYPALHRLEKRGWLTAKWTVSDTQRKARYYRLTAAGRKQLLREQSKWDRLVGAIRRCRCRAPLSPRYARRRTRRPLRRNIICPAEVGQCHACPRGNLQDE